MLHAMNLIFVPELIDRNVMLQSYLLCVFQLLLTTLKKSTLNRVKSFLQSYLPTIVLVAHTRPISMKWSI